MSEIGQWRKARKLKRGYNVRLDDGRWGLLIADPAPSLHIKGVLSGWLSIQMLHTEGVSWARGEEVFSRSPEEQIASVEAVFQSLRAGHRWGEA